jgi:hypothetical protein
MHNTNTKKLRLQDPSEINGDNLNNVRCEASSHFRNKKREYPKYKINELATNSKNKNIRNLYRGVNGFKRGYQPRNNFVKDENGDVLADSDNSLNRWKNYFSQLLNVHNVSLEVEIAIAKLKKYKSPGSDEILAELIQAGGEILVSAIHKLVNSVWNKEEWKGSIIVPIHKKGDKIDCNSYRGISLLSTSYKMLLNTSSQG